MFIANVSRTENPDNLIFGFLTCAYHVCVLCAANCFGRGFHMYVSFGKFRGEYLPTTVCPNYYSPGPEIFITRLV
jgi:hypothetical protein